MSGKNNFCLLPEVGPAKVRSPIALENKYFLLMSSIQLKYHLHLEAFLTQNPVSAPFYASLVITRGDLVSSVIYVSNPL